MNRSMIRYLLGRVLRIEAILLLLPLLVSFIYQEPLGLWFIAVASGSFLLGMLLTIHKPESTVFYLKEGCVTCALSWIMLSLIGALPFYLAGEIPSFTDALFETISGFTTTGASILPDVEAMSHCMLFWRSFTHWIGGMGVLVFLLAVIPMSGGSNINLMRAESPGPSVGKLVPKIKSTARILYIIYIAMTLLEFLALIIARMNAFEAICTALGTAGTGGFGVKADSFAGYNAAEQWIVTIFMILFGVNFNAYYLILFGQLGRALKMEEVRTYFCVIIAAIAIIMFDTVNIYGSFFTALTHSSFQVASIITTTGFASADFDTWDVTSRIVLVILMFIGACAGSTGGGIKVSRFVIAAKTVVKEIGGYIHSKSIKKLTMDEKPVEHEVLRSVNVFFITYIFLFGLSTLLISIDGHDPVTIFTAVAATLNNIGPGLAAVGPTQNFSFFSILSKYVLMFDMLAGRLELFPMLMLFTPGVWKEFLHPTSKSTLFRKK
ncbi:MAG: TrkH family potassium uptake protein [Lachnospiraceae bacterium]|nr:TrkH family potassium uptake protein [Lachnospiraceae bacterium]